MIPLRNKSWLLLLLLLTPWCSWFTPNYQLQTEHWFWATKSFPEGETIGCGAHPEMEDIILCERYEQPGFANGLWFTVSADMQGNLTIFDSQGNSFACNDSVDDWKTCTVPAVPGMIFSIQLKSTGKP